MAARQRLSILTLPGLDHFVCAIGAGLNGPFETRTFRIDGPKALQDGVAWGDILWFEFCWPPIPHILNQLKPVAKKKVVRLHAVEAVHTEHVAAVDWTAVAALIVVSDGMQTIVRDRVPGIAEQTRLVTIHNGVDLGRFRESQSQDMHAIAWVGNIIEKKNPLLALHILGALGRQGLPHRLHFAGRPNYLMQRILPAYARRQGLTERVVFHGQCADMPAFLADKGIVLSTSLHESFGYAIAEGMAVGAYPVVADYPGADEFWPSACRFDTVEDAVALIRGADRGRFVGYVRDRFSLQRQLAALATLLGDLPTARLYRANGDQAV